MNLLHWPTGSYWSPVINVKQLQQNRTGKARFTRDSHHVSCIVLMLSYHADNTENYSTAIVVSLLLTFFRATKTKHQDNTLVNSPTWLQRYTHPSKRLEVRQTDESNPTASIVLV